MIIIMGAVGSGKSEQTLRLANRLHIPRISTSSVLKANLTPEFEAKMAVGDLVDDQEVIKLLDAELIKVGADKNEFILDGSPRSVVQAEWLVGKIKDKSIKLGAIIKLNVSNEVVLGRMLKRGRDDDKKDIILRRLDNYYKITNPVVDYLRSHGITVHEVNGELTPDAVEAEIAKLLESRT